MKAPNPHHTLMLHRVATIWVTSRAAPEYRITILSSDRLFNLPSYLRRFRDGTVKLGSLSPDPSMGILAEGDSVVIWSANRQAMFELDQWLSNNGCVTSGVW